MHAADEVCVGDLGVTWHEQQRRMARADAVRHDVAGAAGDRARHRGTARSQPAWRRRRARLRVRHAGWPLLYQDTSGHWSGVLRDLRPDVAILAAAGRGNIDGEPIQGSLAEFVARQVEMLQPAVGRAQPPRRLASGLLRSTPTSPRSATAIETRRSRDSTCSSSTTSTPPRSSPDVRSQVAGQVWSRRREGATRPARLT